MHGVDSIASDNIAIKRDTVSDAVVEDISVITVSSWAVVVLSDTTRCSIQWGQIRMALNPESGSAAPKLWQMAAWTIANKFHFWVIRGDGVQQNIITYSAAIKGEGWKLALGLLAEMAERTSQQYAITCSAVASACAKVAHGSLLRAS